MSSTRSSEARRPASCASGSGCGSTGREHIPAEGAAIVVPNHKSFWDSFFVAAATKRHLRFMGKSELFEGPWGSC